MIREVTHDKNFISIKMAEQNHKMFDSDKKAIKERSHLHKNNMKNQEAAKK